MSSGFKLLGIRDAIVEGLQHIGVHEPTAIQQKSIPQLLLGHDVIAQAQTGTGKTLAFLLPILEKIEIERLEIQALILTPTRELAIQISQELTKLSPIVGVHQLAAYGGQDIERQLRKLQGSVHVVVATPGRLLDHLRRESISLGKLKILILDEADQMLHMGFLHEVVEVISHTPTRRQTALFSATMPKQVRQLAHTYMREPQEIEVITPQVTVKEIAQLVIQVTDRGKQDALCKAIEQYNPFLSMVFCRTKRRASHLNATLQELGYSSDELHGDLSQAKREQVMKKFRDSKIEILVATDIAARGIDVDGITHIFNYDIPHDADSYIHRIGRTGRAGQSGLAVTFVSPHDKIYLDLIEKGIQMTLPKLKSGPQQENQQSARNSKSDDRKSSRSFGRSSQRDQSSRQYASPIRNERNRANPNEVNEVDLPAPQERQVKRQDRPRTPYAIEKLQERQERKASRSQTSYGNAKPQDRQERSSATPRTSYGNAKPQDREERRSATPRTSYGNAKPQDRQERRSAAPRTSYGNAKPQDRQERSSATPRTSYGNTKPQDRQERNSATPRTSYGNAKPQERQERSSATPRTSYGAEKSQEQRGRNSDRPQRSYSTSKPQERQDRSSSTSRTPYGKTAPSPGQSGKNANRSPAQYGDSRKKQTNQTSKPRFR